MKSEKSVRVRVLTAADMHQSWLHYRSLGLATQAHRPDVVAIVGDALHAFPISFKRQFTTAECAKILAKLPVEHLIFVRGNHEDSNWTQFVSTWPHERRKLTALYGAACTIGPLVIVGFPCMTGSELHWCAHLAAGSNDMELRPAQRREPLPANPEAWLPGLMRRLGPAGRTLWLMHESPVGLPLAHPRVFNPGWTDAVERYSPKLTLSGHDHHSPLANGAWHVLFEKTMCINVGQAETAFHYAVLDLEFEEAVPSQPSKAIVRAFPWGEEVII